MPKKEKIPVEINEKLEELVNQIEDVMPVESDKREELIKASKDGYISEKVSALKKKPLKKPIDKLYREYSAKRKKDADMFLTDLIISQFASALGGLDAIESPESLESEEIFSRTDFRVC